MSAATYVTAGLLLLMLATSVSASGPYDVQRQHRSINVADGDVDADEMFYLDGVITDDDDTGKSAGRTSFNVDRSFLRLSAAEPVPAFRLAKTAIYGTRIPHQRQHRTSSRSEEANDRLAPFVKRMLMVPDVPQCTMRCSRCPKCAPVCCKWIMREK
ncbi:PREDICTED: uncharacterized protein LOC106806627 [Priapulus caudatus]|uniref:Uncharacterized protein LOC106806627 n=1 Tax=Priapulus caudatus TaxID=37621 RepID=A0ABM1DVZ5_PRICU|nr:PREDICTED: uncharacterized protein LOC106806627 [Priapulus caudatus]